MKFRDTCRQVNLIPIDQVAAILNLDLKHNRGPCPTNHDSGSGNPFSLNLKTNRAKCFHCGKSWSVLDLYIKVKSVPLFQAAEDLAAIIGISINRSGRPNYNREKFPSLTAKKKQLYKENWRSYMD